MDSIVPFWRNVLLACFTWSLKTGSIGCPETSVNEICLTSQKSEGLIYKVAEARYDAGRIERRFECSTFRCSLFGVVTHR